ncbi:putative nucleotide-binding protein (sugar kinase/HSP70/actin superfamily) [Halanaerobium saccharolyticum]|uniref:Putative nucleotide-binding protein (Sugar kinase/HSP70/actin superfamily) n=1 Tax=Halanaerobium saccharolyticum TaxID=43595 RepID=A0A4R7YQB6_9FIRM|nr:acyl-CoA dehydratase activase-related protein [Halanaerobium saccharolyticum]RAK08502.1 putative nucleotide-binding protein (sugar kinase/HSP70/actin superfamily) [Halanaerobium saccharolyticum]TDV97914.1 putative nucleotide-binding protein (sugar kinase/HSP70/actin superfamily) [Halanaerobium saccharolyticum]TDX59994.1 putative nucleotide-binding protein (sugar kinase/HSP70/actin superfamily) [Halanaerobium saccharolyticum]
MKKTKIGIPRALLYYYYFPFWLKLFDELSLEPVISDNTSRKLLDKGVKKSLSEICVPIKVIIGHVLNLDQKDVDYIFLPRFHSIRKGVVFCPKIIGLPDMIKHSLPGLEAEIIADQIDSKSDDIAQISNHQQLAEIFSIPKKEMKKALTKASNFWQRYRNLLYQGYLINDFSRLEDLEGLEKLISKFENEKKIPQSQRKEIVTPGNEEVVDIAVIGYGYNVSDQYLNMDILNKLKEMGVRIHTFSMVAAEIIEKELSKLRKPMFWEFTNKLYGAAEHYLKNDQIDGVIHLTAFGCGPDSMLGQILEIDAKEYDKAFMTLRIDEQTGESHIITRIEAFIDLLRLKKENN